MKRILVATDSFKGSLSSLQAGEAIRNGLLKVWPDAKVNVLPVSDGGEGMLEAFGRAFETQLHTLRVQDLMFRPITSAFCLTPDGRTAFVETARSAGLTLLGSKERNPMLTTTIGVGQTVKAALEQGAQTVVIGLGGSGTNDGGMGFASALGFKFFDAQGNTLSGCGEDLNKVCRIDGSAVSPLVKGAHLVAACDVQAPFCGPEGAACVFAPQKGATEQQVEMLDLGLKHFAKVIHEEYNIDIAETPGAGAAGGLGGMLMGLFNAKMDSGISILLSSPLLKKALEESDFIVTGEGHMDRQTLSGKAAFGVMQAGKRLGKPVYALAGLVDDAPLMLKAGFDRVIQITSSDQSLAEAVKPEIAKENLERATRLLFNK